MRAWQNHDEDEVPPSYLDTRLLPDEDPDLRKEILDTLGEEWLQAPNLRLHGRRPEDLIGTPSEFRVREIVRSIRHAGLS